MSKHFTPRATGLLVLSLILASCGGGSTQAVPAAPAPPRSDVAPAAPVAPASTGYSELEQRVADVVVAELEGVEAGRFDGGRMWTFDVPPAEYFNEAYGIDADDAWFERARLGALRIPSCSASIVSPRGLVLTNHHCAREFITQVSGPGENLLDNGFIASSVLDEREVQGFTADQLIQIVDISDRMDDAAGNRTGAERAERIEEESAKVVEELTEAFASQGDEVMVEIVSLYNGGRYSAYVFRQFTLARLVMAPELQIGFFGGDPDNFTFPRYNLDFTLFRLYEEDGDPLDTSEWYFPFSAEGVEEDEPVFIVGNPGSTSRLQTFAELEFRRDVSDRAVLDFLERRAGALAEYIEAWPEEAEEYDLRNDYFSIMNAIKSYRGQLEGLRDPEILARRWDTEQDFVAAIRADSVLNVNYGTLVEQMAALQTRKEPYAPGYGSFLALTAEGYSSPTLHRALLAYQVVNARQNGAPDAALAGLIEQFDAVESVPRELDELLIATRIREFMDNYGPSERWIGAILRGRTPEGVAASIMENSVLADPEQASDAIRRGLISVDDPAIRFVGFYIPEYVRFQNGVSGVGQEEAEISALLGRARYEVYGTDVPPDATFSLRIADGVVTGYPYNGTEAPYYTTFFGMYDRYHSFQAASDPNSPWALPERWVSPPSELDLATPVNFVSTVDIIGGNSGSPVLNADLEVVGVVFDGNIESLPGDYIFLPELNRSVTVDSRGILAALRSVYGLDRIVEELTAGAAAAAGASGS
jgi:hypothetical protein